MDYYEIGQRVRCARKAKGWSQEQLAEKINISVTHMSHIETGNTKLSLPVLVALSEVLDVRTDDLLFGKAPYNAAEAAAEFGVLLRGCSEKEAGLLLEITKSIISAMKQYQ